MTRRTATTITVTTLAVFAVLGLTACDPGAPKPTGSNTPSPTVSSSPTASASDRPMPPQADAPKTSDEAIAAAAKTYHAYLDAQLPFLKDLTLGPPIPQRVRAAGEPGVAVAQRHGRSAEGSSHRVRWPCGLHAQ